MGTELKVALLSAGMGLVGVLVGTHIPQRGARRIRIEDAYADLLGVVQLLLHLSLYRSSGDVPRHDAWVRFGTARARVRMQDRNTTHLAQLARLVTALDDLYVVKVYLDDAGPTDEQRMRDAEEHTRKMEVAEKEAETLVDVIRGDA